MYREFDYQNMGSTGIDSTSLKIHKWWDGCGYKNAFACICTLHMQLRSRLRIVYANASGHLHMHCYTEKKQKTKKYEKNLISTYKADE